MTKIETSVYFNYGMAVGLLLADNEDKESMGIDWGIFLFLGPISISFYQSSTDDSTTTPNA